MNIYQVTIEGNTECWLAEGFQEVIELAFEDQCDAQFNPDDLKDPDNAGMIAEHREWFDKDGLEAVVYIGEVANP